MGVTCGMHGREEKSMQGTPGKTSTKGTTWKGNIKTDLTEIGWQSMD